MISENIRNITVDPMKNRLMPPSSLFSGYED